MCTFSTVRINNNLSSRQSGIAMWPSNDKLTGRVDMIDNIFIEKSLCLRFKLTFDTRNQYFYYIFSYFRSHSGFVSIKVIMLCRNDNSLNSQWLVVVIILNGYLTLSIRAKVCDICILSSNYS